MPFRDNETHLRDILQGIDLIETFVADMDLRLYETDLKTKSAVETTTADYYRSRETSGWRCGNIMPGA